MVTNSNFIVTKNKLQSGFYIVSTPIGNLKDITIRALETLVSADFVLCEDTRVTERLLSNYGIKGKLFTYNDHNEEKMHDKVFRWLEQGKSVALVSDAGTPLISDPGYKIAKEIRSKNFYITIIPGPSAVIGALTLSTMPSDEFHFCGFLKNSEAAREKEFDSLKHINTTIIFYERADRAKDFLKTALLSFGDAEVAIARELTKIFEEVISGKISEVIEKIESKGELKGEVVILINNKASKESDIEYVKTVLIENMKTHSLKEAVDITSKETNAKKKIVYNLALQLKDEQN